MTNQRSLSSARLVGVPTEPNSYYWHQRQEKAHWSLIKPLGEDVTNQIQNPSFEGGLLGWGSGNGCPLTTIAHDVLFGQFALKVGPFLPGSQIDVTYATNYAWASPYPQLQLTLGQSAHISAWVKASVGDTLTIMIVTDGGPTPYGIPFPSQSSVVATGDWQFISHEYHGNRMPGAPDGTAYPFGFSIISNNLAGKNELLIDGVIVTRQHVGQYFDGDSLDADWNGTPHSSTSVLSRFSAAYGECVDFATLGLDIYGDEGWGLPPVANLTTDYARLDGANFQRQKYQPRTITLSGVINSCGDTLDLHSKRREIIDHFLYRFRRQCSQEIMLCYKMVDCFNRPITSELVIPVVYENGFGGLRRNQYEERVTLQFTAYRQPWFSARHPTSHSLSSYPPGSSVNDLIDYPGSEDAWPILSFWAPTGAPATLNSIYNATADTRLVFGIPTAGLVIPAAQRLIVFTGPQNGPRASTLPWPGNFGFKNDVTGQINWQQSDASFFRLVPGHNDIHVEGATGALPFFASMEWTENHVSIDYAKQYLPCATMGVP